MKCSLSLGGPRSLVAKVDTGTSRNGMRQTVLSTVIWVGIKEKGCGKPEEGGTLHESWSPLLIVTQLSLVG